LLGEAGLVWGRVSAVGLDRLERDWRTPPWAELWAECGPGPPAGWLELGVGRVPWFILFGVLEEGECGAGSMVWGPGPRNPICGKPNPRM